jgi:hypothetical protein
MNFYMPTIQRFEGLGSSNREIEGLQRWNTKGMRIFLNLFRAADRAAKLDKVVNMEARTATNRAGDSSWLVIKELVGVRSVRKVKDMACSDDYNSCVIRL